MSGLQVASKVWQRGVREVAGEGNDSGGDEFQEAKGSFDMQGSSFESAEKVE